MSLTISPEQVVAESDSPLLAAPESWPRKLLGEVATVVNGFAFKSKQFASEGGKPLIRIRDISKRETAVGYVGEYEDKYLVQPGDLLVGMDGDFNCARWRGPESLLNQRVCKIVPDPDQLDRDFLWFLLPGYLRAIHDVTSSTTVKHLSSRDVTQVPIPVPPLAEQRKLAELLGLADEGRQSSSLHLGSARRAIERFRRAVLAAACSGRLTADWRESSSPAEQSADELIEQSRKLVAAVPSRLRRTVAPWPKPDWLDLPRTWAWAPMRDLALIRGGIQKQPSRTPRENRYPYLRVANVLRGRLDLRDVREFELFGDELEGYRLAEGDLLVVEGNGSPAEIGRAALWGGEIVDCVHQNHIIRVRCLVMDPHFAELFWNSPIGSREVGALAVTSAGLYSLTTTKIGSVAVPVPPFDEQLEIVRRAQRLLTMAASLTEHVETASRRVERSSQAVLAKAFRGDLVVEE